MVEKNYFPHSMGDKFLFQVFVVLSLAHAFQFCMLVLRFSRYADNSLYILKGGCVLIALILSTMTAIGIRNQKSSVRILISFLYPILVINSLLTVKIFGWNSFLKIALPALIIVYPLIFIAPFLKKEDV